MAFLLSRPESGHTERDSPRLLSESAGIATVLFHPDFNRRLRSCTESADPSSLSYARGARRSRAWASLKGGPYRRWGLSPRPENIGRPEWTTSQKYAAIDALDQGLSPRFAGGQRSRERDQRQQD